MGAETKEGLSVQFGGREEEVCVCVCVGDGAIGGCYEGIGGV